LTLFYTVSERIFSSNSSPSQAIAEPQHCSGAPIASARSALGSHTQRDQSFMERASCRPPASIPIDGEGPHAGQDQPTRAQSGVIYQIARI
jgi:hypothetical protein